MTYTLTELGLIAVIMTFGSVVQGTVGFASGMLGVPLLVLSGFSLPESATINLVSTSVQNVTGAIKLHSNLDMREMVFPVVVRWIGIPCGTLAAYWISQRLDPAQIKQMVGLFLVVVVCLLWGVRISPRDRLHLSWQAIALYLSGFLMGFAAIGGSPMVIYVNSLTWSANKSRGFLFFCSATSLPIAFAMYWYEYGQTILPAVLATLTVMPLIFCGLWLGLKIGQQISKPLFRRITFGLIMLIAISSIVSPLVSSYIL